MTGDRYDLHHIGHGNAIGRAATVYGSHVVADSVLTELAVRLARVRELLERHAAEVDDVDTARAAADAAVEDVRKGRLGRLRSLLSSIEGAAPGVTAVTHAAQGVADLVGSLT